jgi:CheY-like chemotaxis protein
MIVSKNRPTILLVCSGSVMRAVLKEALGQHYNVVAVSGLGGAVDRLAEITPDLMVIRPYLNSIDGHDAAVYLRTKSPGIRVLIVGGTIDDDRLNNRELLQSFEVFPKPYTVTDLVAKIDQVLATPS